MIVNYKNIVYVSHPYGGDKENRDKVENLIQQLQQMFPSYLFISPISAFSFLYDVTEYQEGLDMCLWLLDKCDEMWVFGGYEDSVGCMSEIAYCQNYLIPYHIIGKNCLGIHAIPYKCHECGLVDYDEYMIMCQKDIVENIYDKL